jgi:hypothetical protein
MNQNNGHTMLEDQQDDVGEDEADLEERQWLAARGQKMGGVQHHPQFCHAQR